MIMLICLTYLQRWMHSMHIDAFFEYLLDNSHPYWTEIPTTTNPITEGGRDGVAAEDDMALRSLLPHIRPRRGRNKRPDERAKNSGRSPSSQRARSVEVQHQQQQQQQHPHHQQQQQQQQLDFWAAPHTDARSNDFLLPPHDLDFSNMSIDHTTMSPWILQPEDFANTPLSNQFTYTGATTPLHNHTSSASASNMLWAEQPSDHHMPAEELPLPEAVTPSSSTITTMTTSTSRKSKRHGAKVVSSAWRAGGPGGSGKTRGRPPTKRKNTSNRGQQLEEAEEGLSPFSAFQTLPGRTNTSSPPSTMGHNTPQRPTAMMAVGSSNNSLPAITMIMPTTTITTNTELSLFGMHLEAHQQHDQDHRQVPSQLPLQMPERMGDEAIFAPHRLVAPEIHMMDPFAAGTLYDTDSFHQVQQRQLEHDLRFQTRPQDTAITSTPSFQRTISRSAEMSNLRPPLPPHHLEQQQQTPPRVPPTTVHMQDHNTVTYQDTTDRTNLDTIESLLAHALLSASWHDARGTAIPACGVDEAVAISSGLVETVRKGATSREAFVSNISTLAGTTILKNPEGHTVRVCRMEERGGGGAGGEEGEFRVYDIHWVLRLGDVREEFHLREKVHWAKWKHETRKRNRAGGDYHSSRRKASRRDPEEEEDEDEDTDQDADGDIEEQGRGLDLSEEGDDGDVEDEAAWWRSKYQDLLGVVQEQNTKIGELRRRGMLRDLHARLGPGPR